MTDKVVRTGIEDVLSSIKRLVNEEDRKSKGVHSTTTARKPSRLVLTDALRVGDVGHVETTSDSPEGEVLYRVEDSVKPMILRACDIVKHADPASEQQSNTAPKKDPVESLSAKIEALETAIAKTEDQWEPDGDSDDEYAGTPNATLVWGAEEEFALIESKSSAATDSAIERKAPVQEELESAPVATFVRSPRQSSAEEPKAEESQVKTASLTLDEDMLRSLIAQVVREELQGVLGQRITRNVRKMVRREIHRALADQKVD